MGKTHLHNHQVAPFDRTILLINKSLIHFEGKCVKYLGVVASVIYCIFVMDLAIWLAVRCSFYHLLSICDGSGYMAGCEVITCLGVNEMKVITRKGYVPNLKKIKRKY